MRSWEPDRRRRLTDPRDGAATLVRLWNMLYLPPHTPGGHGDHRSFAVPLVRV